MTSLSSADVLINYTSTVTIQAWLIDVNVINLNILPSSYLNPYSDYGYSSSVTDLNKLNEEIISLANRAENKLPNSDLDIPHNPIFKTIEVIKELELE